MSRTLMAAAVAAVAALGWSAGASAEDFKLKVASYHPATSLFIRPQIWMLEEITKRTDGKVTFETYWGGALLKAADIYPGLARGAIDIGVSVPGAFNPREYPLANITIPFMSENMYAAMPAYVEWYQESPAVQKEFERGNARLLLGLPSAENVLWTQRKVETAEDLKGMRIRTVLGPADALVALGATAVATPYTEAIELLERGGVDGISTTPFEQGVKDGLGDITAYLSQGGRMGLFAMILTAVNLETWNELPPEIQKVFDEVATEAQQKYIDMHKVELAESVEDLKKAKKVEVVPMDPAEEKRWADLTRETLYKKYEEGAKRVGADGRALIERFEELLAKYEPEYPYTTGIDLYLQSKN